MLCDICGENEAIVHVLQIVNGEKKLLHLCKNCAAGHAVGKELCLAEQNIDMPPVSPDELNAMLHDVINKLVLPEIAKVQAHVQHITCPHCGQELPPEFFDQLFKTLNNIEIQASSNPMSRKTQSGMAKVSYLEHRLKSVISEERYEEAAAIRKEINRLKEKTNKS
ncbi:MAG: hypothetical protein Q4C78_02120 [Synergistaceae bacterium]|nr:hypothetical protein [Synergistaceae bacterium]